MPRRFRVGDMKRGNFELLGRKFSRGTSNLLDFQHGGCSVGRQRRQGLRAGFDEK